MMGNDIGGIPGQIRFSTALNFTQLHPDLVLGLLNKARRGLHEPRRLPVGSHQVTSGGFVRRSGAWSRVRRREIQYREGCQLGRCRWNLMTTDSADSYATEDSRTKDRVNQHCSVGQHSPSDQRSPILRRKHWSGVGSWERLEKVPDSIGVWHNGRRSNQCRELDWGQNWDQ